MSTPANKIRLVLHLRRCGVTDTRVLSAVERVPRELFVPDAFQDRAFEDTALPIGHGQTLSQPLVVARMTEALQIGDRMKVLEVGTGSGYHAAVLALLCRRLYTIERLAALKKLAEQRFTELDLRNVTTLAGDGRLGWKQQAPFDRICVTAAAAEPPSALVEQLAVGGFMVMPLGARGRKQTLVRYHRTGVGVEMEKLDHVRFVPLVESDEGEVR